MKQFRGVRGALGLSVAVAAVAVLGTACNRDPSAGIVQWAADACACTNKACAEEVRDELPEVYEDLGMQLIDTRMKAAENLGAVCLTRYSVVAEQRLNDASKRPPVKGR